MNDPAPTPPHSLTPSQNVAGDRNQAIGQVLGGIVVYVSGGQAVFHPGSTESTSAASKSTPSAIGPNPYKGLTAFQETDGDRFFGREKQITALWEKLRSLHETESAIRVLPIYGPSGSGKSSLARAGLIPELARHPIPGYDRARVAVLVPGTHPLESLATVLARIVTQDLTPVAKTREFAGELKQVNEAGEYDGLRRIADVMPDVAIAPLVVLVDQLEEVYTLCKDKAERDAFIGNLLHAAGDRAKRVTVIVTLRSDFLGETQKHAVLNRLFSEQGYLVPAMTPEELRQAIAKPAELAGHPLDPATIDLLVKDTEGREGALPLLQFALTRIWEGLAEGKPPAETLKVIGGVGGALAGEAQRIYDSLDEDGKAIARRLFLGLVQLGEGTKDTRRRALLDSLVSYQDQPAHVRQVIGLFASPGVRLITLSANGNTETAEVTHEALFESWQQLQSWLDNSRDDIRFQRRLDEAAHYWEEQGQLEGSLWRSPDLELLQQYYQRVGNNMTPLQVEFCRASQQAEHNRKRRRRLVMAGLISGLVLAITTSGTALFQLRRAEKLRMGLYETLAEQSVSSDPMRSLQDGILAVTLGRSKLVRFPNWSSPAPVTEELIEEPLSRILPQRVLHGHSDSVLITAFSPNGKVVATGDYTGEVRLWTAQGQLINTFQAHENFKITSIAFSVNNQTIITGAANGEIRTWDLNGNSIGPSWTAPSPGTLTIAFLPTGQVMQLGLQASSMLELWDIQKNAVFPVLERFAVVALSPHQTGFFMVGGDTTGTIRVLDTQGKLVGPPVSAHQEQVRAIAVSQIENQDESYIATAGQDKKLRLWKFQNNRLLPLSDPISLESSISSLAFTNHQGQPILISGDDSGVTTLWNLQGSQIREPLATHEDSITAIAVSPDGKSVVTGGHDYVGRLWQLEEFPLWFPRRARQGGITSVAVAQDVPVIVTGGQNGTIRLWNREGVPLTDRLPAHPEGTTLVAIPADGQTIISAGQDGKVQRWQWRNHWSKELLGNHDAAVNSIALTSDGQTLVSGDETGTVWLWHLDSQATHPLHKFDYPVKSVFIAPNGSKILALSIDGTLNWWNADELQSEHSFLAEEGPLLNGSVVLSPSGQQIATGADSGQIQIWSLEGQLLQTITNADHQGNPITSFAFSPDGKKILSGGWNAKTYLWNLEVNSAGTLLEGHGNQDGATEVNAVAFLPDGQIAISVGADDTLRFWRQDWQGWLPIACQQMYNIIRPDGVYTNIIREPRQVCKNQVQQN
ncbi:AAA family ATPase [Leptolyngbya sp. AN02str]|uniref:nSTAND1 domain-containing NTPase n=1 Tax=Leptolyngbya sp. AN02str TaxID=3423363 RepID=UPI003D318184